MAHINIIKSGFQAGEINETYYARADLALYRDGAKRLENVDVLPSGGLQRRPGLRHTLYVPESEARLYCYRAAGDDFLMLFTPQVVKIYRESPGKPVHNPIEFLDTLQTPWLAEHLRQLNFTYTKDFLLICHPQFIPQRIAINPKLYHEFSTKRYKAMGLYSASLHRPGVFTIAPFAFKKNSDETILHPYQRFENEDVEISLSTRTTYQQSSGKNVGTITFTPAVDKFTTPEATGTRIRVNGGEVELLTDQNDNIVRYFIIKRLRSFAATKDWQESAFSPLRGWPKSACFHQGRLVFGGNKNLPNNIWMSRTGDYTDFNIGEGEDDSAIDVKLASHGGEEITQVVSARHLQIFTTYAEWVISDDPITPSNIKARRQTNVGSPNENSLPPIHINGATIFCSGGDASLREYVYTDLEETYAVNNLNALAPPLKDTPRAFDYDPNSRRIYCVHSDGTLRVLALYRQEKIIAWSRYRTQYGRFLDFVNCGRKNYVLTKRGNDITSDGQIFLETFDKSCLGDYAYPIMPKFSSVSTIFFHNVYLKANLFFKGKKFYILLEPRLGHHEDIPLKYLSSYDDGGEDPSLFPSDQSFGHAKGASNSSKLDKTKLKQKLSWQKYDGQGGEEAHYRAIFALPIEIIIESAPPALIGRNNFQRYRLLEAVFHIEKNATLTADTGLGLTTMGVVNNHQDNDDNSLAEPSTVTASKMKQVGFGWHDIGEGTPWIIRQDDAYPFKLLSVEMRLSIH